MLNHAAPELANWRSKPITKRYQQAEKTTTLDHIECIK